MRKREKEAKRKRLKLGEDIPKRSLLMLCNTSQCQFAFACILPSLNEKDFTRTVAAAPNCLNGCLNRKLKFLL